MKHFKVSLLFLPTFVAFFGILSFTLFTPKAYALAPWYNPNWLYRTQININHNQIASSTNSLSTNFPVLISTTTNALKYTGSGGHVASSTGNDIIFTDSTGTTTLNYEIESYASTTGALIAWVKIPTLATSTDTTVYMYYGNASATTPASSVATGVWNDGGSNYYKAVWHLSNGTTLGDGTYVYDSTASLQGALSGTTKPTATTGQIDGGANFSSANGNYIRNSSYSTIDFSGNNMTVSGWVYPTSIANGKGVVMAGSRNNCTAAVNWQLYTYLYPPYGGNSAPYFDVGSGFIAATSGQALPLNQWSYLTGTYNGSVISLYINGAIAASTTSTGSVNPNTTNALTLGDESCSDFFNGTMDEFRLSSTARSADWIKTEYNNQKTPSAFETMAVEEAPTLPNAPTGLTLTPTSGQIALSWTAPVNTGGFPLTDYVIDYKPSSSSVWSTYADGVSTTTNFTITGLINGTSYDFRVSSVTSFGQGSPSPTSTASPTTYPDAPANVTAVAGNTQATISFTAPNSAAKWYDSNWGYRQKITIDHTKVGGSVGAPLNYFPVLVSTTSALLEYTGAPGGMGRVGTTTGKDIFFTLSDGTTKLNHEIESYSSTTGNIVAWVQVPSLASTNDTVLYMYYGNPSSTDQSTSTGTWDDGKNYYDKGVWHLTNGTTLGDGIYTYDSTTYGNRGILSGTTIPVATTGKMDGAAYFNYTGGSNLKMLATTSLDFSGSTMTISGWVYPTSTGNAKGDVLAASRNTCGTVNWQLYSFLYPSYGGNNAPYFNAGSGAAIATSGQALALNQWSYVTGTYTGSNVYLYVNGNLIASSTSTGTVNPNTSNNLDIGDESCGDYFGGNIDELHLTSVARSADWIKTEYNNQNSPGTFESITNEEASSSTTSNGGSAVTSYTVTSSPGGIITTGYSSPITVTGLTNGTQYTFTMTATNVFGTSSISAASNPITPSTIPDPPTGLTATPSNASVALSWTAAADHGSAITNYIVDFKLTSTTTWSQFGLGTSTATNATVTGLTNGLSYDFEIYSVNANGPSASPSSIVSSTPITILTATTTSATSVSTSTITFNGSILDTGGSNATQSGFTYGTVSDLSVSIDTTRLGPQTGTTSFAQTITGLTPNTQYYFRAYAVNAVGTSTGTILSTTTLRWAVPGAPTIGSATAGNATATISFSAPIDNGGSAITTYTVTSNPDGITSSSSTSPITISGLTNGRAYTFTVTATNAVGTGPASSATSPAVTPATVPDSPTAVSTLAGAGQMTVSWSAPSFNGGSPITDYTIQYKPNASSSLQWITFAHSSSTATTTIITGLTNGTLYNFQIAGVNAIGRGAFSSPIVNGTPFTTPNKPTNVVASVGNTSSSVSFTAPADTGGSAITSYTVTSSPDNQVATGSSSPILVTGLTNGTPYTFTVAATNAAGTGPSSDPSNSVTPATIPDAPTSLIATAGQGQVGLTWTAPGNNGGSAITDYVISYKVSTSSTWANFAHTPSTNTYGTVTGLINGTSYDFEVSAVNSTGQGSPSIQTSATPVTTPDAPTIGTATPGNGQATLTFTPPSFNGGSSINSYTVTSNPGGYTGIGSASPITVTGLTNGTSYTFVVTATNAVGVGASSTPSNSITPVTVPDAPTTIVATPGNRQASIAFTAPTGSGTGGTPITYYTVTSSPGGITGTGNASPIIVTGLTKGATYQFTVTATNAVGTSSNSSLSNQITLSDVPGAPTNLAATVQGGSIALNWSAPSSDGGSSITDYIVEYELSTNGTWSVFSDGTSISTSAVVTGLADRTPYDFRVSAVNAIGQSSPSNIATSTPGEPAQVIIESFPDLTVPSIGTAIRITNEGSSEYEYQYTWCVNNGSSEPCGSSDDIFDSTAAKLIQPGTNFDTTVSSTVPVPGNYWFHVQVVYGSQTSVASQSFTAVATYPDPPTNVTAATSTASQATVSFTAPSANGSPITVYTVTSSPGGITATGSDSPIIVPGLTNGTSYTFTVTATNIVGTSKASSPPSNAVVPITVPDSPTNVTAVPGDSQVALSWTAPLYNGGSPVTDYVIQYKQSTDSNWLVFADGISTLTTATVTGLTNDISYDFEISAVNAAGQSSTNSTSASLAASSSTPPNNSSGGTSGGPAGGTIGGTFGGTSTIGGGSTLSSSTTYPINTPDTNTPITKPQPKNISLPTSETGTSTKKVSPIPTTISSQTPTITNTKPITNRITVTPTEHPKVIVKVRKPSLWSIFWWLLLLIIIILILRRSMKYIRDRNRRNQQKHYDDIRKMNT